MNASGEYSFQRYLAAKKSVDDRALNRVVWGRLREICAALDPQTVQILEVGAGIGTMLERILDWGLVKNARYLGLDPDGENIQSAWNGLSQMGETLAYRVIADKNTAIFCKTGGRVEIQFENADLDEFAADSAQLHRWQLVIAHAVLDLLHLERALPAIFSLSQPGGTFYFTINFDGVSIFEPVLDRELDEKILALYHRSMDERAVGEALTAGSQAGRKLFQVIADAGGEILEAGASDWVVYPRHGRYPHDEAYFLQHILYFIETTLSGHPDLDQDRFKEWLSARREQIAQGRLVYVAHQLDFLGKVQ